MTFFCNLIITIYMNRIKTLFDKMSLPQYNNNRKRKDNDDPKLHPSPGSKQIQVTLPSLYAVNTLLIIILFILVFWLGSRHYHVTQEAVKHHLGKLQLKTGPSGGRGGGGGEQTFEFILKDNVGEFTRYNIPGLVFEQVSRYRLCCIMNSTEDARFLMCDYGEGATNNVGLECMIHSDAYATVWIQDKGMVGSKCTLYWWE
jgi:hypothetical protein